MEQGSPFEGSRQTGKEHVIDVDQAASKEGEQALQALEPSQVPRTSRALFHKIENLLLMQEGSQNGGSSELGSRELLLFTVLYFLFPDESSSSSGTPRFKRSNSTPRFNRNNSYREAPEAINQLLENAFRIWKNLQNNCESSRKREGAFTIYRVAENIRLPNIEAYEPMVVTIGPYHHLQGRQQFREMEAYKPKCIRYLLNLAPHKGEEEELTRTCVDKMKELENEARSCYSEDTSFIDSDDFSEVLLHDGCFIIYLLLDQLEKTNHGKQANGSLKPEVERPNIDKQKLSDVKVDLLKLENQIPFFIVQALFDLLKPPAMLSSYLVNLALRFFHDLHLCKPQSPSTPPLAEKVHHLLHIFHLSLAPFGNQMIQILDLEDQSRSTAPTWIPSATELRASGMKIRKKEDATSILDITCHDGQLEMPVLHLVQSTTSLVRNLIAFELYFPSAEAHMSSYATFIKFLLHSEEDVRLLYKKGVLMNNMSTDKEAAQFFKQICSQGNSLPKQNYLKQLFIKVGNHHASKRNKWIAEAKRSYCSSPWVALSVFAGFVLLVLTCIQTIFSIIETIHELDEPSKGPYSSM